MQKIQKMMLTSADKKQKNRDMYDQITIQTSDVSYTKSICQTLRDQGYNVYSIAESLEGVEDSMLVFQLALGGIGAITLLVAAIGIINTMVMSIYERTKEIAIMKYVGATDWFIRWPFVLEGMVLGLLGSLVAAVVLRTAYTGMAEKIYDTLAFFPLIPEQPFLTYITIVVVLSGMAVGAIGSAVSIKRFLKV